MGCNHSSYNEEKIIAEEMAYLKNAVRAITEIDEEVGAQIGEDLVRSREIFERIEFSIFLAYNTIFKQENRSIYDYYMPIASAAIDEDFIDFVHTNKDVLYYFMGTEQAIACFITTVKITIDKLQDSKIDG